MTCIKLLCGRGYMKPIAILVHVPDISVGLEWYKKAFPMATANYLAEFDFTVLTIGEFMIEIVQADEKVGVGKSGTVLYWSVENVSDAIAFFSSIGATLYRGPLNIENGFVMCQVEDPFGNLIGLRGKTHNESILLSEDQV